MDWAREIAIYCGNSRELKGGKDGYLCSCPNKGAHANGDKHASFTVENVPGSPWPKMFCHSQHCEWSVLKKILVDAGKYPTFEKKKREKERWDFFGEWPYHWYDGSVRFVVKRYDVYKGDEFIKKVYTPKFPNPGGVFEVDYKESGYKPEDIPLFNLLGLADACKKNRVIFIVEGEKCARDLIERGLVATTPPGMLGGSKKVYWKKHWTKMVTGAQYVVLLADGDSAGIQKGLSVARALFAAGIPVKWVRLPNLRREKDDVYDWFRYPKNDRGELPTVDDLKGIVSSAEFWTPEPGDEYVPEEEESAAKKRDEEDPLDHCFTELGNALWFKKAFEGQVAYMAAKHPWLIYKNGIWTFDKTKRVKVLFAQAMKRMKSDLMATGRWDKEKIDAWVSRSTNDKPTMAALNLAAPRMELTDTSFNMAKWKIAARNCVIDLQTGLPLDHSPAFMWNKRIDVDYNPDMGWEDAPRFREFMRSIFPDDDPKEQQRKIDSVIRCFAVSLTGDPKFRKWFLLWGPQGREGKSTLAEIILSILGDEVFGKTVKKGLITEVQQENKFTDPGNLKEMRFALMEEIGKKDKIDNEKMKSVTGNDSLSGSKLFMDTFTFRPSHYIYVYGNSKPRFDAGGDTAAQDRCVVIPFLRHFEEHEIDDTLADDLQKEKQAILTILVFACVSIWNMKSLGLHKMMLDAKSDYLKEEDLFGQFLSDCIEKAPDNQLASDEIYQTFTHWAKEEQGMQKPWAKHVIGKELNRRGYKSNFDSEGYKVYRDIKIKPAFAKRRSRQLSAYEQWQHN